jgi:Tfp pilus assembly protein PilZ
MDFVGLYEEFKCLNDLKRTSGDTLAGEKAEDWRRIRRTIEKTIFGKSPDPDKDSRKFVRVPVYFPVTYKDSEENKAGVVTVLGERGMFAATSSPRPVGTTIEFSVIPGQSRKRISIAGKVVYTKEKSKFEKSGMGIQFVDLTKEQKSEINSIVDESLLTSLMRSRRYSTLDVKIEVVYLLASFRCENVADSLTEEGLTLKTREELPAGTQLKMNIKGPEEEDRLSLIGEITGGDASALKIRFVDLSGSNATRVKRLTEYCTEHGHESQAGKEPVEIERAVYASFVTSEDRDLTRDRIFIQTNDVFPVGSEALVTIFHPVRLDQLVFSSKVAPGWSTSPDRLSPSGGVSLEFTDVDQDADRKIESFLS